MRPSAFRLLSLLALLAVAASLMGCGKRGPKAEETESAVAPATPVTVIKATTGDLSVTQSLTGTVEPNREADVQSEVAGKVAWVGCEVGDTVSRGQALVRLDTALAASGARQSAAAVSAAQARYGQSRVGLQLTREQSRSQVTQSESAMEAARNRLRQARTAADLTRSRVEDGIEQARLAVKTAESQMADVKAGVRSQEINQAQARVEQARSALRLAKLNLERSQSLLKSGAVAQAQVDAAQVEYDTAAGNVRVAEQGLDLAKEGARSEQVRMSELGVAQARQVLAQAEVQRGQIDVAERDVRNADVALAQAEESVRLARAERARIAATEQDVRAAGAAVRQAAAAHTMSRTQVSKHIVYSPISGIIAARNVDPGEGASPGIPLIRVVNLNPVKVACEASELQVRDFTVGQQAEIAIDALPGRAFIGRIIEIAPQVRSGERIFIVRFAVDNPGGLLRAGLFARAQVITGLHQNVVVVPRDVMVERGEKRVVYLVEGNKIDMRDVKIGAVEGNRVEIERGVRSGDLLVFGGQSLLAQGQSVEPQLRGENGKTTPNPAP